jgi:hypothetical protein
MLLMRGCIRSSTGGLLRGRGMGLSGRVSKKELLEWMKNSIQTSEIQRYHRDLRAIRIFALFQ